MAQRKKDGFAKMRSWMSRDIAADSNIAADAIGLDRLRDLCETSAHFAIKGFVSRLQVCNSQQRLPTAFVRS